MPAVIGYTLPSYGSQLAKGIDRLSRTTPGCSQLCFNDQNLKIENLTLPNDKVYNRDSCLSALLFKRYPSVTVSFQF